MKISIRFSLLAAIVALASATASLAAVSWTSAPPATASLGASIPLHAAGGNSYNVNGTVTAFVRVSPPTGSNFDTGHYGSSHPIAYGGGTINTSYTNVTLNQVGTWRFDVILTCTGTGSTVYACSGSTVVASPNRAPTTSISATRTTMDTTQSSTITFSAADADSNLKTWRFYRSDNPGAGTSNISGGSAGPATYSFSSAVTGTFTFIIEASDTGNLSHSSQIQITVNSPPPEQRLLTGEVSPAGSGNLSGLGYYLKDSTAHPQANAASGWVFTGWSGAASGSTNPASVTMNADKHVIANFSRTYSLSVNAGTGGSASGSASGLAGNATRSISASANSGYTFSHWSGDTVSNSSSASTTISINNADRSVTANFTAIASPTYTLTVNAGSGGSASGSANGLAGSATRNITATPSSGYTFSHWSGDTVSNSSSASTTIAINNANRSVTANFTATASTYSLSVNAGSGGSASGSASGLSGSATRTITATPSSGYTFSHWSGDTVSNSSSASTTIAINNANRSVTANFTATASTYSLNVNAGSGGSASGSASGLSGSATRTITATPSSGYTFSHWSGDTVSNSSSASTTIAINNANRSVTANFTAIPTTYTLTVNAGAGGSASGSAGGLSGSATRTISATPNTGYTFSGWSGDAVANSSASTTTIAINNSNRAVTANFTPSGGPTTYTLAVNAGAGGTATGSASGLSGAATPTISATPNSGYTFTGWTGDTVASSSSATTTIAMNNASRAVTANFAASSVWVNFTVPTMVVRPSVGSHYETINFTGGSPSGQLTEYMWSATTSNGSNLSSASWTAFSSHTENGQWVPSYTDPAYYTMDTRYNADLFPVWQSYIPQNLHNTVGYGYYERTDPLGEKHTSQIFYEFVEWDYHPAQSGGGYYEQVNVPDQLTTGSASASIRIRNTTPLGPISLTVTVRDSQGRTASLTRSFNLVSSAFTLSVNKTGSGTVTGAGSYGPGDTATITATPEPGWQFSGFTGDLVASTQPATLLMDASKTVTANFIEGNHQLTTSVNPVGSGTVTAGGSYPANTWVSITATPTSTTRFVGWTGDATGSTRPLMVQMTSAKSIVATFSQKLPQTINFPNPGNKAIGSTFTLSATASSGLPVVFTLDGGPASLIGSSLTVTGAGLISVTANQPGDETYLPAAPVTVSFTGIAQSEVRVVPKGSEIEVRDKDKNGSGTVLINEN